ncbi:MAG: asparagine synthetase B [Flavobacteriales bacterium]
MILRFKPLALKKNIPFVSLFICLFFTLIQNSQAAKLLIPMDDQAQKNHLKAYGIAFWLLENDVEVDWLLNYRGGSFMCSYLKEFETECVIRGVSYELISDNQAQDMARTIQHPEENKDLVKLEKAPKIAVYSPKSKQPWDDAVTLALTYAEIPYDIIYDDEIFDDLLAQYDWLHLHHEDFTGQYGKFYRAYKNAAWYIQQKLDFEANAKKHGYDKVSDAKLAITKKVKEFVIGGGFLFAMCSATDSYDIALAAEHTDICGPMFDGDPIANQAQKHLNYDLGLAFTDYSLYLDPNTYEFSTIDATQTRKVQASNDFFSLFDFSAKWDPVPTMLTQNHTKIVKGFMGQTTSYNKQYLKSDVLILGENRAANEAKYIHGKLGKGMFTFYGGHDPEDYQHRVGDPKTELDLHPQSPGYRLILNNVLFPAAKKRKQKT